MIVKVWERFVLPTLGMVKFVFENPQSQLIWMENLEKPFKLDGKVKGLFL